MSSVLYGLLWFLGAVVGGLLGKFVYEWFDNHIRRRRDKRFLRYARLHFPTMKSIEVISVGPTDKQAMENIERRIRDASRNL